MHGLGIPTVLTTEKLTSFLSFKLNANNLKYRGLGQIGLCLFAGLKLCTVGVHSTVSSGLVGAGLYSMNEFNYPRNQATHVNMHT